MGGDIEKVHYETSQCLKVLMEVFVLSLFITCSQSHSCQSGLKRTWPLFSRIYSCSARLNIALMSTPDLYRKPEQRNRNELSHLT